MCLLPSRRWATLSAHAFSPRAIGPHCRHIVVLSRAGCVGSHRLRLLRRRVSGGYCQSRARGGTRGTWRARTTVPPVATAPVARGGARGSGG
eukprot:810162-Prorocentrum_minimum.AAC.1